MRSLYILETERDREPSTPAWLGGTAIAGAFSNSMGWTSSSKSFSRIWGKRSRGGYRARPEPSSGVCESVGPERSVPSLSSGEDCRSMGQRSRPVAPTAAPIR